MVGGNSLRNYTVWVRVPLVLPHYYEIEKILLKRRFIGNV